MIYHIFAVIVAAAPIQENKAGYEKRRPWASNSRAFRFLLEKQRILQDISRFLCIRYAILLKLILQNILQKEKGEFIL